MRSAVGVQPMSEAFNALVLEASRNRPFNPMVNAGAIAVAGILADHLGAEAFEATSAPFAAATGEPLGFDEEVYRSEAGTGHRNRALAHLLHGAAVFRCSAGAAADLHVRQCSLLVTARDLAALGATLAHVGTNPVTEAEVFGVDAARDTLSGMFTCGL